MTSRIEQTFTRAKKDQRACLIPFIMGGDPDLATTATLLNALPEAGANIIEIGIPFSDPMADGPVIQAAGRRALAAGATVSKILDLIKNFRKKNADTPLILMGYYNPIYCYGAEKFCKDASTAGADGIIVVDLPPEEEDELRPHLDAAGLKLIRLVAPTSDDQRLQQLTASASGFIYYISITGITGAIGAEAQDLKQKIDHLRSFTSLPVAAGFGIKTPQQAREAAAAADAVVVGSALVEKIAEAKNSTDAIKTATGFVGELAKGLKRPSLSS